MGIHECGCVGGDGEDEFGVESVLELMLELVLVLVLVLVVVSKVQ